MGGYLQPFPIVRERRRPVGGNGAHATRHRGDARRQFVRRQPTPVRTPQQAQQRREQLAARGVRLCGALLAIVALVEEVLHCGHEHLQAEARCVGWGVDGAMSIQSGGQGTAGGFVAEDARSRARRPAHLEATQRRAAPRRTRRPAARGRAAMLAAADGCRDPSGRAPS
eukprot:6578597-Prymnesium_polylepis.2